MSSTQLPPGWSAFQTPAGRWYYYDEATKKSTWTRPQYRPPPAPGPPPDHHNEVRVAAALSDESLPTSVYIPWHKPGSRDSEASVAVFRQTAGDEAAFLLKKLQDRHVPCNFSSHPNQAVSVAWEESWSSTKAGTRDPNGEVIIHKLGQILRKSNQKFTDPFFPADLSSLFVDPSQAEKNVAAASTARFDQDAFLAGKDIHRDVAWKRVEDICNPKEKAVVFSGSISPDDVQQGQLGNCYFIAALAACATASSEVLINDLVIEDYLDVGLIGIKFYVMGKWITVAIDDQFPCTQDRGQWKPLFAAPKKHSEQEAGEKEIWPMLFEKAFAKLNGSYESTDAGMSEDALQLLTGGVIDYLSLTGDAREFERLRSELSDVDGDGFVCCGCRTSREGFTAARLREVGLFSGHAYSLTKAIVTRGGVRLVQVHNPWGRCEWNGRYSDKSAEMTPELLAELKSDIEEDGGFYMEFSDFCTYFGRCKIVDLTCFNRLSEDSLSHVDGAAGYWLAGQTAGGRLGPATFECNPKFELTGDGGEVLLTVYQPDTRHTCIAPVEKELGDPFMEVYLYFGPRGQRPAEVASLVGGFDGDRLKTVRVSVEAGVPYHIVVTAAAAGQQGAFSVTACGRGVVLKALPLTQPPPQYAAAMAARDARRR